MLYNGSCGWQRRDRQPPLRAAEHGHSHLLLRGGECCAKPTLSRRPHESNDTECDREHRGSNRKQPPRHGCSLSRAFAKFSLGEGASQRQKQQAVGPSNSSFHHALGDAKHLIPIKVTIAFCVTKVVCIQNIFYMTQERRGRHNFTIEGLFIRPLSAVCAAAKTRGCRAGTRYPRRRGQHAVFAMVDVTEVYIIVSFLVGIAAAFGYGWKVLNIKASQPSPRAAGALSDRPPAVGLLFLRVARRSMVRSPTRRLTS